MSMALFTSVSSSVFIPFLASTSDFSMSRFGSLSASLSLIAFAYTFVSLSASVLTLTIAFLEATFYKTTSASTSPTVLVNVWTFFAISSGSVCTSTLATSLASF